MISKETVLRIIEEEIKNAESSGKPQAMEVLRRLKTKVNNISEHSTEKGTDSSIDPDDRYYEEPGTWKSHGYVDSNGWTYS